MEVEAGKTYVGGTNRDECRFVKKIILKKRPSGYAHQTVHWISTKSKDEGHTGMSSFLEWIEGVYSDGSFEKKRK